MLKPNSVLTVMLQTLRTPANAMALFGLVEEMMNKEIELQLGINSECGVPCLKLMKLSILDAINGHLDNWNLTIGRINHAGVNQNHLISQPCVLKRQVMTAFATVE